MRYFQHFKVNIKVALRCLVLTLFHFAHGMVPIKLTSHVYWGIEEPDDKEEGVKE